MPGRDGQKVLDFTGNISKNDCVYLTKMKGSDDTWRIHIGVVYVENVIPKLHYGGLDGIRMGGDRVEGIIEKNTGNY